MSAASWIKSGRALRRLTQEDLARAIRRPLRTVARWEAGESEPRWSDIEAIARALELGDPFERLPAAAGYERPLDSRTTRALLNGHRPVDTRSGGLDSLAPVVPILSRSRVYSVDSLPGRAVRTTEGEVELAGIS